MLDAYSLRSVVVLLLCFITGCSHGVRDEAAMPSAKKVFSDPAQLRLAEAVERGDQDTVSQAIRLGGDVDAPGRAGIGMLMWAMLVGSVDGFSTLLDHDANLMAHHFNPEVMRLGQKMRTVAEYVCVFPDKRFLEAMLAHGFDPNSIVDPKSGETVLFYAVFRHDLEAVRRLIDAGANVNVEGVYRENPLAQAIAIRDYRIAVHLYSKGGDPLAKNLADYNVIDTLKMYGSRGVTPEQQPYFEEFIAALESRGLITKEDIIEADKPKRSAVNDGPPGITVIEHAPDSEAGRAIRELDRREREANRREGR